MGTGKRKGSIGLGGKHGGGTQDALTARQKAKVPAHLRTIQATMGGKHSPKYDGSGGRVITGSEAAQHNRAVKLAQGDQMWGYSENDLDMSKYTTKGARGAKGKNFDSAGHKKKWMEEQAYKKALKENKFGVDDYRKSRDKGFIGNLGKSLKSAGKTIVNDMLPAAALVGGGVYGASLAAPLFAGAGAAGAAGGAATPMGSGFLGIGPGVASMGGGGAAAAAGGAGGLANIMGPTGSGFTGAGPGVASVGGNAMGHGGLAGLTGGIKSGLDVGGGVAGLDWLKGGFGGLNYGDMILGGLGAWMSDDAMDDSRDAIKGGWERDNPFAPHQPEMAQNFLDVIRDPSKIEDTPGYRFTRDQGLKSLFAKQAASGNRFSGRALSEATQYGSGLASQMYNTEIDRMANWAQAGQPRTGGAGYGQNLSSIGQQDSANWGNFAQDMWSRYQSKPAKSVQDQEFTTQ